MSAKFGWCAGPDGAVGDHATCPYELGQRGVIVRCGCPCHETRAESVLHATVSSEGHPRGNGDGPLTRITRSDRERG